MDAIGIGIDLGTTNSCAAILIDGKVKIVPNESSHNVTPSWVTFTPDGVLVGSYAKDIAYLHVSNAIYEFKRLMGEKYSSEKIQNDIKCVSYKIVDGNGIAKVEVDYQGKKKQYSPEELSCFVLAYLKDATEQYIGKKVNQVVVTVPAYFNDFQRQATKQAALIAGFEIVNIINEPTAAALAYSHYNLKKYRRNILVYDFGGGTFDVSVVKVGRGECIVLATNGDSHLGGTDIDYNILNYIKKDFKMQYGIDLIINEVEIRRLKNKCESVKKNLSGENKSSVIEMSKLLDKEYFSVITKTEFDILNKDIFDKTMELMKTCLKQSKLVEKDIDEVLLVGGSSRIPMVQTMLKNHFGEDKISYGINPDEAVAYGAAIHVHNLQGNLTELKDVNSKSLGIECLDKSFSIIIPCNTSLPVNISKEFCTVSEDVSINIFQGEENVAEENFKLGSFVLKQVNFSQIDVKFEIDMEGILKVTANSKVNDSTNSIAIDIANVGLSPKQIDEHTDEIRRYRNTQADRKEFNESKFELEMLNLLTTEAAENHQKKTDILKQCSDLTEWLKKATLGDKEEVKSKISIVKENLSSYTKK